MKLAPWYGGGGGGGWRSYPYVPMLMFHKMSRSYPVNITEVETRVDFGRHNQLIKEHSLLESIAQVPYSVKLWVPFGQCSVPV
jgi:hypothetical protein